MKNEVDEPYNLGQHGLKFCSACKNRFTGCAVRAMDEDFLRIKEISIIQTGSLKLEAPKKSVDNQWLCIRGMDHLSMQDMVYFHSEFLVELRKNSPKITVSQWTNAFDELFEFGRRKQR